MARQCTKPKRPRNSAWFKEKAMLAEALESGMVLDEEQMAFLADNEDTVTTGQHAVLMAKLSSYDSNILSKVPIHNNYLDNHVMDPNVQETRYFEQLVFDNDTDIDITSDSNMISYEQYLKENENTIIQDTTSHAQQEAMIMFMIEEMNNQVAKCNKVDKENKIINESLTAELERYKEQIKFLKERQKFDLNDREKYIDSQLRKVTLEFAEESRLKMHAKQNEPIVKEKKVNIAPIDYVALNKLSEHFVKHFVPQKQLSAEQAFWLPISKPVSEIPPVQPEPVLKEIPHELPTINLVHTAVNYLAEILDYQSMEKSFLDEYSKCVELKADLSKKNDMVEMAVCDEISKRCSELKTVDLCVLDYVNDVNVRVKSKSVKSKKKKVWKPIGRSNRPLVPGLRSLQAYDWATLSAHQLY
ncbi:hypothetical protein Tco_0386996 [Tanacetum coccineum]